MILIRYTDRYASKYRYSKKYPIGIPHGLNLHQKFVNSDLWEQVNFASRMDMKNDNRLDVFRGNNFTFKNVKTGTEVLITSIHSNTGKTVNWEFASDIDVYQF